MQSLLSSNSIRRAVLLTTLSAFAAHAAHAQANLTFSGGNNTPLTLTLTAPVTYTVTTSGSPFFVFRGVDNVIDPSGEDVSGNLKYSINTGTFQPLQYISLGSTGARGVHDLYIYSFSMPYVNAGDVVTLRAGNLTTANSITAAAPASGSFTTFLIGGNGTQLDGNNVSAPEPGSLMLAFVGGMGLFARAARRKITH